MAKILAKRRHHGAPKELVVKVQQLFDRLPYESNKERAQEEVAKALACIKEAMFGDPSSGASKEVALGLTLAAIDCNLLRTLVENLPQLGFEARKDAIQIFDGMVRIEGPEPAAFPGSQYIEENNDIIDVIFEGYDDRDPEISLDCGELLRSCIRDERIAEMILRDPLFLDLFDKLCDLQNFEVASDVFNTFKDLLTRHKAMVANLLKPDQPLEEGETEDFYSTFFTQYRRLLESSNYVTRRQSVKLLGELLCDKNNHLVMKKYISSVEDFKIIMCLLRDSPKAIQFEAFHVFKIFVANPKKSYGVHLLLYNNQEKLLRFLEEFQLDREDEQFKEERAVIIDTISRLMPPEDSPPMDE